MKNKIKWIITSSILGVFMIAFSSCNKKTDYGAQEQQQIASYVKMNNITATPDAEGLYYIPGIEGTGKTPTKTGWILFSYSGYFIDTTQPYGLGQLFDSTDTTFAISQSVLPNNFLGGPIKGNMSATSSWIEGFLNMKEGGTATFIVPSGLWNYDYNPRLLTVKLEKVFSSPRSLEIAQIDTFINDSINLKYNLTHSLGDTTSGTVPGVYYLETTAGTGSSPVNGSKVTVNYTGKLIDGRVFVKQTNYSFYLGENQAAFLGVTMPALEAGIKQMKAGSKGSIIIPYHLGFNSTPIFNSAGQVFFEAYSTLAFNIELVSFTAK